jgi:SecD/SecF fusion protein
LKREKIWALVILVLIGLSAWVVFGTHRSKSTHSRVDIFPPKYGLDISGGVRAVLQAQTDHLPAGVEWNPETRERVRTTLENRINASGVGEASVQPKGDNQFIIELPDVKNKDAILEQLGTTASMTFYYFRDVVSDRNPNAPIVMNVSRNAKGHEVYSFFDKRTGQPFRDGGPIKADFTQLLGEGTGPRPGATLFTIPAPLSTAEVVTPPIYLTPDQQTRVQSLNREYAAWKSIAPDAPSPLIILSGADILPQSQARMGGTLGSEPEVTQEFTPNGARAMSQFTREHAKEIMGIVLDDSVLSAPRIDGEIDDEGEISGGFQNLSEAVSLANLLNAGALPVPLQQVEVQSIEASLGAGAVHKGVIAGLLGLAFVLVFMLAYYRLPGLVADIALIIYALFTLAIFRVGLTWLGIPVPGITLTLPGIAGFILSIGMAVDANILIFERMKEELRSGKSLRSSIDAGFRRAFSAIRDSNICTAITCIVLLSMGTPSVKGFATTLLLGVIVSLFSAITVTRTLLYLLVDAGIGNNPRLFGLNVGSRIGQTAATDAAGNHAPRNIIGRRKVFYTLSALIIVPGLFFWLGPPHGLKKSIEFTGGSQIEVRYTHSVAQSAVQKAVEAGGFKTPTPHVQMANGGTDAIVSVAQQSSVANPTLNPIHQRLVTALNTVGPNTEQQFGNVGGVISAELTRNAFQAVVIAAILITLYLATVFGIGGFVAGLRLGASAIAALLHDVLVLLGAFAIFGYFLGWEIDSLFVTAMLTVIGFSVHDTVVIFDRVRENLRHKARGEAFEPLVNRSINQTLSRSINTSLTVLMTLLALIILGGQTTRQLNWALFIGILSGTYSSIFNAASILVDWENWLAKRPRASGTATYTDGTAEGGTAAVLPNGGTSRPFTPRSTPTVSSVPSRPKSASSVGTGAGTETSGVRPKKKKPARRF